MKNIIALLVLFHFSFFYFSCNDSSPTTDEEKNTLVGIREEKVDKPPITEEKAPDPVIQPVDIKQEKDREMIPEENKQRVQKEKLVTVSRKGAGKETLIRTNSLLSSLHTSKESFKVNSSIDNTITTKRGTVIKIPKDCFVNSKGYYERGDINLEVKELLTPMEMFALDLPTVSDGKMLVSDGVMYINATSGGEQLKIWEGKSIEVKMASQSIDSEMMVFELDGTTESRNWVNPRKPGKREEKKKNISYSSLSWRVRSYPSVGTKGSKISNNRDCGQQEFFIKAYKKGTERDKQEFMDRIKYISALNAISQCYILNIQADSYIDYYLNAPGHNFNTIDTKVLSYLMKHSDDLKKVDGHYCIEEVNKVDTLYLGIYEIIDQFRLYSMKKNWMPDDLASYGVDLDSRNPLIALEMKAKLSREEAEAVMEYHKLEKEIKAKRNKAREHYNQVARKEEMITAIGYTFTVNNLGYINIDKFYNEPGLVAADVAVKVKGIEHTDYAKVGMIFQKRKSFLSLYKADDGSYSLTKSNIPSGDPVKIVAVIYSNNKVYYGERELTVSASIQESIDMKEITLEELKKRLG